MKRSIYQEHPTWESVIESIREESGYWPLIMGNNGSWEYWELDNQFHRDKHGRLVDNWVFTLYGGTRRTW